MLSRLQASCAECLRHACAIWAFHDMKYERNNMSIPWHEEWEKQYEHFMTWKYERKNTERVTYILDFPHIQGTRMHVVQVVLHGHAVRRKRAGDSELQLHHTSHIQIFRKHAPADTYVELVARRALLTETSCRSISADILVCSLSFLHAWQVRSFWGFPCLAD